MWNKNIPPNNSEDLLVEVEREGSTSFLVCFVGSKGMLRDSINADYLHLMSDSVVRWLLLSDVLESLKG